MPDLTKLSDELEIIEWPSGAVEIRRISTRSVIVIAAQYREEFIKAICDLDKEKGEEE